MSTLRVDSIQTATPESSLEINSDVKFVGVLCATTIYVGETTVISSGGTGQNPGYIWLLDSFTNTTNSAPSSGRFNIQLVSGSTATTLNVNNILKIKVNELDNVELDRNEWWNTLYQNHVNGLLYVTYAGNTSISTTCQISTMTAQTWGWEINARVISSPPSGSTLPVSERHYIDWSLGTSSGGTVVISSGGTVNLTGGSVSISTGGNTILAREGSIVNIMTGGSVNLSGFSGSVIVSSGGSINLPTGSNITISGGTINLSGGTINQSGGTINNYNSVVYSSYSALIIYTSTTPTAVVLQNTLGITPTWSSTTKNGNLHYIRGSFSSAILTRNKTQFFVGNAEEDETYAASGYFFTKGWISSTSAVTFGRFDLANLILDAAPIPAIGAVSGFTRIPVEIRVYS